MVSKLGGSQISTLLESVPGIARVLRSPVADAIVNMIRAGAGIEGFNRTDAEELIRFAVRRGLISGVEGDEILAEIKGIGHKRPSKTAVKKMIPQAKKANPFRKGAPTPLAKKAAEQAVTKTAKKATKNNGTKKPVKKSAKRAKRR